MTNPSALARIPTYAALPTDCGAVCPVRTSLEVLGGKWKLLVISHLLDAPQRYGELRRLIPDVTEKMLIQVLRELETHGLVHRTVHQQVPPRVDYSLTEQGRLVQPVFEQLLSWGQAYLRHPVLPLADAPLPSRP